VVIDQRHFGSAWGANKKEAEQKAAYNALVELGVLRKATPRRVHVDCVDRSGRIHLPGNLQTRTC